MVKRYLRSGIMENGVVSETEEGLPQGGNLSPLLANIYLNEFDQEYLKRGVPCVRYADDIVLLAKSERAAKRVLETSTKYQPLIYYALLLCFLDQYCSCFSIILF